MHNCACLLGECPGCGVTKLCLCNMELDGTASLLMQWHQFSLEKTKSKNGQELKKLSMVYMHIGTNELLDYLKLKLQHFVHHNYQARWQDKEFRNCMKEFMDNVTLPIVDISIQHEVQSMHWYSFQIIILIHIAFHHNPNTNNVRSMLREYHFYINDDWRHDFGFVQHAFLLHWRHLTNNIGFTPKAHWVWSDGGTSQFKSTKPWYFVSQYPQMIGGCSMLWSFFGFSHDIWSNQSS